MNIETFLKIVDIKSDNITDILDSLIIYLRKSRKDMDYFKDEPIEKTLQRHEKELQDYITSIFGKPIPEYNIYREVASGDTIEDRPVIQKVLNLIEKDSIKGVVCIEIERLARGNSLDQGIIAQTFQYTNTKIITPFKIYNLDNEDDLSYFEDGLFQSRKYLKYTKRILNRGRIRSVKDGKYVGSLLPYGYDKVKLQNEKGYVLVENPSEATIVRLIADLYLNGLETTYTIKEDDTYSKIAWTFGMKINDLKSMNENIDFKVGNKVIISIKDMRATNISNYLNYLKIKGKKRETWTANMVRNILQSPSIYGYLIWNRRKEIKSLRDGKIIKETPYNDDYILVKGRHTAILSEDIKKEIEAKIERNSIKTIPINKDIKNPLVGLVRCSVCGRLMTRRPYKIKESQTYKVNKVDHETKDEIRLFLRSIKGNKSLTEISKELNVSKCVVNNWFSNTLRHFSLPNYENWIKLKQYFNIDDKYDNIFTIGKIRKKHEDTLICSSPKCKCVGSDLFLVEKNIIENIKEIRDTFNSYITNYEEEVKKELINNTNMMNYYDKEIIKNQNQFDKICDLLENGTYTQELFIARSKKIKEQIENFKMLKAQIEDCSSSAKLFYQRKKCIPIIDKVLREYNFNLNAKDKNKLLNTVVKGVIYTKSKGGLYFKDNFSLDVILNGIDV